MLAKHYIKILNNLKTKQASFIIFILDLLVKFMLATNL